MSGLFTQSAYVLVFKAPALDELEAVLGDFEVQGRTEAPADGHWAFGGESILVGMPGVPEARIIIDVVDRKWPDTMGDPTHDPVLFAAWSAGGFGPSVFPGNLERAGKQAWVWRQASGAVRAHHAWVRLRSTFAGVDEGDGSEVLASYDPKAELTLITQIAGAILSLQTAMAYFNPNGESLRPEAFVQQALTYQRDEGVDPLDVWTNIRLGRLNDDWVMMDLVGLAQVGLPDIEVCFKTDAYAFEDVDRFIRNVAEYLYEAGDVIGHGDMVDGPGDISWEVLRADQGLHAPPRPTLRLLPDDGTPRTRQVQELRPMASVVAQAQAEFEAAARQAFDSEAVVVADDEGEG